jgi:hypothetical protein
MSNIIKRSSTVISLFIVLIIFTFANCRKGRNDKELTLPLVSYSGVDLSLDGYYFEFQNEQYEIFFLYRNGVILYGGSGITIAELSEFEGRYSNGQFYESAKDSKTDWGRFNITGLNIKYEKWNPSTGGPLQTYLYSGIILNDTTFQITTSQDAHGNGDVHSVNYLYQFKKFSPKPDSTNQFTN